MTRLYFDGPTGRMSVQVYDGDLCGAIGHLYRCVAINPTLPNLGSWYCEQAAH